jgi:H+/Cl- antiporter ClcA
MGCLLRRLWIREPEEMSQSDFFTLYFASLGILGGLAGYVITHLLSEIKRLNSRVDEIYNILLDR